MIRGLSLAAWLVAAAAASAGGPVEVSPAGHKAMAPEIAVAADGAIHIIWLERTPEGEHIAAQGAASKEGHTHEAQADLWLARSADGGATFSTPVRINPQRGAVWGFPVSKPRLVATADGTLHVFYPGNSQVPGSGKPIVLPMYTRSTDGGRSFSAPSTLGTVPASDHSDLVRGLANAECFGTLTADGQGGVFAYWVDTRDMSAENTNGKIFSAVSIDGGRSFAPEFEVFPADACPCCQITATTHAGRVYMGSRQVNAAGERNSVVAVSSDRGRTFEPRVRWGGAGWKIEACPLKATALAIDGDHVYAASFDGGANPQGAAISRSTDGGKSFGEAMPLHPGAAISDAPVLAISGELLVAAWHAKTGAERRIHVSVSRDRGASFGTPAELPAPAGTGIYPVLAPRGNGVQVAWQQGDRIVTRHLAADDPLLGAAARPSP
jgi:hypothetical protein